MTVGVKFRRMPNSLNDDRDGHVRAGALRHRNRELAAGEEAGFLAALGDEVRLREALKEPLRLHRANHQPEVELLAQQEEVQEVAEGELALRARHRRRRTRCWPSTTPGP